MLSRPSSYTIVPILRNLRQEKRTSNDALLEGCHAGCWQVSSNMQRVTYALSAISFSILTLTSESMLSLFYSSCLVNFNRSAFIMTDLSRFTTVNIMNNYLMQSFLRTARYKYAQCFVQHKWFHWFYSKTNFGCVLSAISMHQPLKPCAPLRSNKWAKAITKVALQQMHSCIGYSMVVYVTIEPNALLRKKL